MYIKDSKRDFRLIILGGYTMKNNRVLGDKVNVNYDSIAAFFEGRREKKLDNKYNLVLFQDDCPELAIKRDEMEKKKISPLLSAKEHQRVLDIGCGIGRWGEYLLEQGLYYVGIDGSSYMIEQAEENLRQFENKKLLVGIFQELLDVLKKSGEQKEFDMIFVNGVFMYLNDEDYIRALDDIKKVAGESCIIYVKESMARVKRLTLDEIYSESLTQEYSAIYRSIKEYDETLRESWCPEFELKEQGELFPEELVNRKETLDYYLIFEKTENQ